MNVKYLGTGTNLAFAFLLSSIVGAGGYYIGYKNGQQSLNQPSVFSKVQRQYSDKLEKEALALEAKSKILNKERLEVESVSTITIESKANSIDPSSLLLEPEPIVDAVQMNAEIERLKQIDVTKGRDFYADRDNGESIESVGLSDVVISSYEQETGITNADIEKAMNRHN